MLLNHSAPDFTLPDEDGYKHSLKDYLGHYVLLYFYPKDMTSGCTLEAQCFRNSMNDLKKYNIRVLGVSADSVESHQKFKAAHRLNFSLLADTEKEVIQKYGIWKEKSMYGKKYMGIARESVLINPEGIVVKHYEKVQPAKHAAEVLEDIHNFQ